MGLDLTISIGNMLTMLLLILGGIATYAGMVKIIALLDLRLKVLEKSVEKIEINIESIAEILRMQAVQGQVMADLQRQITEMKHGEGFIFPLMHSASEVPPKR